MNKIRILPLALFLTAAGLFGQSKTESPMVINPRISTDRSVDCGSIDRILGSLIAEGMSDEEKVLAVFNWIRRVIYHGDGPEELAFDFGQMVHSLGNGSCLRQTAPMALLLGRLGFQSESWVHDSHHMIQVRYGGGWHCFDPHMNFWVRGRDGAIASIGQLRADSTLALDAVAEQRSAPGFLLCGDSPRWFSGAGQWRREESWPELKTDEPFGRINLRRGEFITFNWTPGERFYRDAWKFDYGAYHTCGPADRADEVNWPLYEPHGATVNGTETYRHWAEGKIVYHPDLYSDNFQDGVVRMRNIVRLCPCFVLMPQDLRHNGEMTFLLDCPYIITGGSFALQKGEQSGPVRAQISLDGERSWIPIEVQDSRDSTLASFVEPLNGHSGKYHLKIIMAGDASLTTVEITTNFQHNPYALPYLMPGENVVSVDADTVGALFRVQWAYAEGPDWNRVRQVTHSFQQPGEFKITVGGEKYPRNLSLTYGALP